MDIPTERDDGLKSTCHCGIGAIKRAHCTRKPGIEPNARLIGPSVVDGSFDTFHDRSDCRNDEIIGDLGCIYPLLEANVSAAIIGIHSILVPELLRAIWQSGYRIPEDLSIVCLQADEIAKDLIRPMTSVSFDVNAV